MLATCGRWSESTDPVSNFDDSVNRNPEKPASLDKNEDIPGHLQPLGSHRPPEGHIDIVEGFLEPETFYTEYVHINKPVLFRGAAEEMVAFQLWDDKYLK